ncbi:hypothetical protein [Fluviicola chungangensis]|uniref:Uncharacterized protein n=1 Tax=Fluviicola chungangensis TaxID=2597671 RepID=A0A556MN06_9FLAO|nr:hypothetical protein [Fluviicola chungangensis]TSJ41321.1 hypothetical protein FO442_15530 [Fluviicola chungangensis]
MHTHKDNNAQNKGLLSAATDRFSKEQKKDPELKLADNRPQALIQQKLQAAANDSTQAKNNSRFQAMADNRGTVQRQAVIQLARTKQRPKKATVSGHGGLRRDKKGDLVPYKIPKGKTIVITAPPGATLGDISLVLNSTNNPDYKKIRKMMKISTNKDLWKNSTVISIVRQNTQIGKTDLQTKLLEELDTAKRSFKDLKGSEKGSLAALERKPEFEEWAESYVTPETFQVKKQGEEIDDMQLEPFEDELRSSDKDTAKQTEYIEKKTFLSDYVDDNPDLTYITVNACSDDPSAQSDFTGFQIDKK